ncbi:hypothetical protein [Nocardia farcinica]|uniref:hypothetical protein n=1 Tax=Nocardia farcinica TaxID=37329 RepID=UPI00245397C9|nr:hypothetical protein [Nocardia farcinica]
MPRSTVNRKDAPDVYLLTSALLLVVGAIHLAPGIVALSPRRARDLYGTAATDPDLALLLRHRAVLLALVGAGLMYAAFTPAVRPAMILAGFLSMLSFLAFAARDRGNLGPRTRRVARIDLAATVLLLLAGGLVAAT